MSRPAVPASDSGVCVRDAAASGRALLLAELDDYAPFDEREREMTEQLRAFVAAHDDCFERTMSAGHVTGSAWVVERSLRRALLMHHRKLERWLQFGGHADGDSDVRRVALREAREESGLEHIVLAREAIYDIDVHPIPARGGEPAHLHYDVRFACFADPKETLHPNAEAHALAWVELARIEDVKIDDSVRRLARKTETLCS